MPDYPPSEAVLTMRQQGLSNDQIITALQRQGYNTNQILTAMNQADITMQTKRPIQGETMPDNNSQNNPGIPAGAVPGQNPDQSTPEGYADPGADRGQIEEIAESIIEEKWNDLMENINRIVEWKDKTETRLVQMETMMKNIKDDFDKMHTAVLERVGEYDKHIGEVGTEVKALEKVFQKILPGFIENVSELSRITQTLRTHHPPQ